MTGDSIKDKIILARVGALQAIGVAAVTAVAGVIGGYMSRPAPADDGAAQRVTALESQLRTCEDNVAVVQTQLDGALMMSQLTSISAEHFESDASEEEVLGAITQLVGEAEKLSDYRGHYAFRLFEVERLIPNFGSNINTQLQGEEMTESYSKIQEVLKGVGHFQGPINGDQGTTYAALVGFQSDYNERRETEHFDPVEDFGYSGYKTLEALRSTYR